MDFSDPMDPCPLSEKVRPSAPKSIQIIAQPYFRKEGAAGSIELTGFFMDYIGEAR